MRFTRGSWHPGSSDGHRPVSFERAAGGCQVGCQRNDGQSAEARATHVIVMFLPGSSDLHCAVTRELSILGWVSGIQPGRHRLARDPPTASRGAQILDNAAALARAPRHDVIVAEPLAGPIADARHQCRSVASAVGIARVDRAMTKVVPNSIPTLQRRLGMWSATALVVSNMIGTRNSQRPVSLLGIWESRGSCSVSGS